MTKIQKNTADTKDNSKKSFLLYCDLIHTVNKLNDEQAGRLLKHILAYVNDKNPVIEDQVLEVTFEPIKQQLKRDLEKYRKRCKQNKINGNKGGRPRKPKKPNGLIRNPTEPKKADSDNDTDIDTSFKEYSIHNTYLKDIKERKDTDYAAWLSGIYGMYKLKPRSIGRLLDRFCLHLKTIEKVHSDISGFKKHFSAWLGTQDQKQLLNEYKTRKVGAL